MRGLGRSLTLVRKLAVTLFSIEENDGAQERVSQAFATRALRRSERRSAMLSGWNSPLAVSKLEADVSRLVVR